jgi:release factor glutamine methyltransferase
VKSKAATVASLLDEATHQIAAALGVERREARLEARVLAAHAWQVDAAWLIAHDTDQVTPTQQHAIECMVARRKAGEPVAYILGEREFFGLTFSVTSAVLIPRPDTELLVDAALQRLPEHTPCRILDLGTGSGAVAIALARQRPMAAVVAVEASAEALAVAQANARQLGADNVHCVSGNWFSELGVKKFDMIVANPPYIPAADPHLDTGDLRFEPRSALAAGPAGLDDLGVIIAAAPAHLAPEGWLLVEHGWNQGGDCRALFEIRGYSEVHTLRDLAGQERVSLGRHSG